MAGNAKTTRLTRQNILSILQKYLKDPLNLFKVIGQSRSWPLIDITKYTSGRK